MLCESIKDDDVERPGMYLLVYWSRCQQMLDEVGGVIGNLELLVKAAEVAMQESGKS